MCMLAELFAAAVFGATVYLKAKENAPKNKYSHDETDTAKKFENLADGASRWIDKEEQNQKNNFRNIIRTWDNKKLAQALSNTDSSEWQYDLIKQEIYRRKNS